MKELRTYDSRIAPIPEQNGPILMWGQRWSEEKGSSKMDQIQQRGVCGGKKKPQFNRTPKAVSAKCCFFSLSSLLVR